MILLNTYSGLLIDQAVIESTNGGHPRSVTHWYQVRGTVIYPGESKYKVGQEIAWPYHPDDWEEWEDVPEPPHYEQEPEQWRRVAGTEGEYEGGTE